MIEDLRGENIRIPDEIPPPDNHKEHDEAVKKAMAGAHLAIHLLDNGPGRRIRDFKESTYPRGQLEIGLESDTRQLIWVPRNLKYEDIADEKYKEFLDDLEFGEREKKNFHFVREPATQLKDVVLREIEEITRHFNIHLLDNSHSPELDEKVLEPLLQSCKAGGGA